MCLAPHVESRVTYPLLNNLYSRRFYINAVNRRVILHRERRGLYAILKIDSVRRFSKPARQGGCGSGTRHGDPNAPPIRHHTPFEKFLCLEDCLSHISGGFLLSKEINRIAWVEKKEFL
jgi:hypothetical protein